VNGFLYVVRGGHATELALDDDPHADAELIWVHLSAQNEEAEAWLAGEAGLPDYVVDGLIAVETRPRCTVMPEGALLNLRGRSNDPVAGDLLASVRIFAHQGRVYSVTRRPLSALDTVRETIAKGAIADPGDLIAEFAAAITEELDPVVATLGDELDDCESQIDAPAALDLRRTVNRVRSEAIGYRRFLFPQRAALEKLATLDADWLHEDDRLHLNAAADRAARMAEEVEAIRERAGLMHETLTDLRAELLDQRSLTIAIVAMVFLPLTFLTGLLGMNVEGIPFSHEPWAFAAVVVACLAMGGVIAGYFIRKHWTR